MPVHSYLASILRRANDSSTEFVAHILCPLEACFGSPPMSAARNDIQRIGGNLFGMIDGIGIVHDSSHRQTEGLIKLHGVEPLM